MHNGLRRQIAGWLDGSSDGEPLVMADRLLSARVLLHRTLAALGGPVEDSRPKVDDFPAESIALGQVDGVEVSVASVKDAPVREVTGLVDDTTQ